MYNSILYITCNPIFSYIYIHRGEECGKLYLLLQATLKKDFTYPSGSLLVPGSRWFNPLMFACTLSGTTLNDLPFYFVVYYCILLQVCWGFCQSNFCSIKGEDTDRIRWCKECIIWWYCSQPLPLVWGLTSHVYHKPSILGHPVKQKTLYRSLGDVAEVDNNLKQFLSATSCCQTHATKCMKALAAGSLRRCRWKILFEAFFGVGDISSVLAMCQCWDFCEPLFQCGSCADLNTFLFWCIAVTIWNYECAPMSEWSCIHAWVSALQLLACIVD